MSVAIIGAGPSGLVTAKTLLDHGFSPVIFDTQRQVGGLWNVCPDNQPVTLDPQMPTNLSRFTVAFSDLDWESVLDEVPVFPRARQVARYLSCYAERYIPQDILRLGCKVVATERRDDGVRWKVQWLQDYGAPTEKLCSEDFDFLVVASGYFAEKYIPSIPGLAEFSDHVIHSSTLHRRESPSHARGDNETQGTTLVIGGSMSGVEAASAVALGQSSLSAHMREMPTAQNKVHHIHSRPFWALPTYLPHGPEDNPSFQPLDLAMYDLSRRPPGPVEYALGPIPEEKVAKTNGYFQSLLGDDYEKIAHMATGQTKIMPPWVAIGNDYAEFVRAGAIQASMGRVLSVHPGTRLASVQYAEPNGDIKTIEDVGTIVMATGFTPFKALSVLPEPVLSKLEYCETDPFSPLILDKGGTVRSEIPDVGFVGFYRGPYWGIMEMQARFLGQLWSGTEAVYTEEQKASLRLIRAADPDLARGQFPMGDYVGLMETFAKELGIRRTVLDGDQSGPVIPARYRDTSMCQGRSTGNESEATRTLVALGDALHGAAARTGAASAIFRALHGGWKSMHASGIDETAGEVVFRPRYPTSPAYDREYVVETGCVTGQSWGKKYSLLRLAETPSRTTSIEWWSVSLADGIEADCISGRWALTPLRRESDGGADAGYVISARSVGSSGEILLYTFHFRGVSIATWECVELDGSTEEYSELDGPKYRSRTVYRR
ncbi:unnamed protein product [Penicillium olsonii]|uniref:Uncharacterized protein n=1 Tax=Penicillium olsonii TaxID=99116 RepID=A0A9W4HN26_PENOL|nr:unnamed protein product [Penicillium olsonii]CAG8095723.1 unnamed protein product [Penicillium olsonii]